MPETPAPLAEPAPQRAPSKTKKLVARLFSVVVVLGAIALAVYLLAAGQLYPRTDDAYVQARYISVSSQVPGRIAQLAVVDGAAVTPGQLLVQVDPASYRLAVEEATAQVAALQAQLKEAERQRAATLQLVDMAQDNTERMLAKQTLAQSTYERMTPLAEKGFVTRERYDTVYSDWEQARAGVLMAKSNELAAELSVPSLDALRAELQGAQVSLQQAQLELERTQIKAPFAGRVVNCDLAAGMMVMPGEALFTLVDTTEWFVVANFREGDLKNIREGDAAQVRLLTLPDQRFTGTVISIGHAVQTQDAYNFGPLPTVRNQLNWVRVAQRFPVRIRINEAEPQAAFRVGASAVVTIDKR